MVDAFLLGLGVGAGMALGGIQLRALILTSNDYHLQELREQARAKEALRINQLIEVSRELNRASPGDTA